MDEPGGVAILLAGVKAPRAISQLGLGDLTLPFFVIFVVQWVKVE